MECTAILKNKNKYDLSHLEWETVRSQIADPPYTQIILIYENKPIISFRTEKAPFKAILEWLEMDLEDY